MFKMSSDNNNNKSETKITIETPREDLINTAVKFLTNPNVSKTPFIQQQKFLKSKGLTESEISIAFTRTEGYRNAPPVIPAPIQYVVPQPTFLMKLRDGLQSLAIIGGITYVVYLFYKRYIEPYLFGKKKKKSIEEQLQDLDRAVTKSVKEVQESLARVHVDVERINSSQFDIACTERQLADLKAEIVSVKGLLLGRKQFPSLTSNSPVMPPSIPAWQLSSAAAVQQGAVETEGEGPIEGEDGAEKSEELIEIGSGSGSSETEVNTKNSDSSIEIIDGLQPMA